MKFPNNSRINPPLRPVASGIFKFVAPTGYHLFTPLFFLAFAFSIHAQDSVTISKSRLQELERKEAELEKLKGELSSTKGENVQLKKQHEQDAARTAAAAPAQAVATHTNPPLVSLPPFTEGEIIDAMDLANYYKTDAAAADQRFRKRTFKVRGEIAGFEKPPFIRGYRILLKTADPEIRLVGSFSPPDKYNAVFTIKNGVELVGQTADRSRERIARVGQIVLISGRCRGVNDSAVRMAACDLSFVP